MQLKRPHLLFLQRHRRVGFSLAGLLSGGDAVPGSDHWLALAPHLGAEVELEAADLPVFEALDGDAVVAADALARDFGSARIERLVGAGLLIGNHPAHAGLRRRDQGLREGAWWGPAALMQAFGRSAGATASGGESPAVTWTSMVREHGLPPAETLQVRGREQWLPLPTANRSAFDTLLGRRTTCRNFDAGFRLPLLELATLLHRVFGAQACEQFAPGVAVLKKNSPSGGGLHPIEAYLLVQRVDGLSPGLYHYHSGAHVLEAMRMLPADDLLPLARQLVLGQDCFADAPVLVLLAARFQRSFWKYRRHGKAWQVVQLDAGHLSQNLYLSATEQGLGAFITAAIDEACAERLFEIDGLEIGAVAVCGFGRRGTQQCALELDPLEQAVR